MAAMTAVPMDSLNSGFRTVEESVGTPESSKDDLSARVEETAGAVGQIRQNLKATNGRMEDHSSNVVETTAAVEELARNIESPGENNSGQVQILGRLPGPSRNSPMLTPVSRNWPLRAGRRPRA